jgi:hypothetical protein
VIGRPKIATRGPAIIACGTITMPHKVPLIAGPMWGGSPRIDVIIDITPVISTAPTRIATMHITLHQTRIELAFPASIAASYLACSLCSCCVVEFRHLRSGYPRIEMPTIDRTLSTLLRAFHVPMYISNPETVSQPHSATDEYVSGPLTQPPLGGGLPRGGLALAGRRGETG